MARQGYGLKEGSQRGWNEVGRGRNRTEDCRHPEKKKAREEDEE